VTVAVPSQSPHCPGASIEVCEGTDGHYFRLPRGRRTRPCGGSSPGMRPTAGAVALDPATPRRCAPTARPSSSLTGHAGSPPAGTYSPARAVAIEPRGVPGGVIAGLCEHPGAEDRSQPGLRHDDLRVRVLPKIGLDLPLQGFDLIVQRAQDRSQGRTEVAYATATMSGWPRWGRAAPPGSDRPLRYAAAAGA
jgi:hypothetical protein